MPDEGALERRGDEVAVSRADMRVSHADRDRAVEVLQVAAVDGRLTADELDERLGAALTARTYGELVAVTSDLMAGPLVPVAEPKEDGRIECRSSNVTRDGRWIVPKRLALQVSKGNLTLDFTDAVIVHPTVEVNAELSGSKLTLVTKPGIVVDTDELAAISSAIKIQAARDSEVPVELRIVMSGTVKGSLVTAGPIGKLRLGRRRAARPELPE